VTFLDNASSTAYCGGALDVRGDAVIQDSTFVANVAGAGGRHLPCAGHPHPREHQRQRVCRQSSAPGSVARAWWRYLHRIRQRHVHDGSFVNNHARRGGAIYSEPVTATVTLQGTDAAFP